jgi:hypothetical protein
MSIEENPVDRKCISKQSSERRAGSFANVKKKEWFGEPGSHLQYPETCCANAVAMGSSLVCPTGFRLVAGQLPLPLETAA